MRKVYFSLCVLLIAVAVFAAESSKAGLVKSHTSPLNAVEKWVFNAPEDFEYNTGGAIDFVPDSGGSADGWGPYFIATTQNNSGTIIMLTEFGFPCGGPGPVSWYVWTDVGGLVAPGGDWTTADYTGEFTPTSSDPDAWPPTTYSYIDVSGEGIVIEDGAYFCWGYENPGMGGQTSYNGVVTWTWYGGVWDPDSGWGRTNILQAKGIFGFEDDTDPAITEFYPTGTGTPLDSDIGFHVTDDISGCDTAATVYEVLIEGVPFTVTGDYDDTDPLDVAFTLDPVTDFPPNTSFSVSVEAYDFAGNGPVNEEWWFDTYTGSLTTTSLGIIKANFR